VTRSLLDPRQVPPDLLRRYDVQGPRYTSYPPAPHFRPVPLDDLFDRWRRRNDLLDDPGMSVYVHIPFCRVRCLFCGCHTFGCAPDDTVDAYLDGLLREMDLAQRVVDPARPVRQVALGGGTPTYPPVAWLDRLLSAIDARFRVTDDAERSIEVDPRTATPDRVDVLLNHGFNRFSLGIQDFDPDVMQAVGRIQPLERVEALVTRLRARSVPPGINFDLLYGLPGQTLGTVDATADRVLAFRPDRIALFGYAHVPWMRPHQDVLAGGLPTAETKAALGLALADRLLDAGYRQVGMDHFALPADPLVQALDARTLRRTFMGYTTGKGLDNLGLGVSAISWIGASFSQDEKDLAPWRAALDAGRLPVVRGHLHSADDLLRQSLIMALFCTFQADLDALSAELDLDAPALLADDLSRLTPMVDDGLVTWDAHGIHITETGRFFVRNVCMVFDRYLEAGTQRYSRTV